MERIAVVGAGLIGRAWAMVFARAGCEVRLWDKVEGVAAASLGTIRERLADLKEAGLIEEAPERVAARISAAPTLAECVAGAVHVQENGPERLAPKQELFAELDRLCPSEVVLASSTSGIQPASSLPASPGVPAVWSPIQ
jgi:L-gulonate 3-dehydrogenase